MKKYRWNILMVIVMGIIMCLILFGNGEVDDLLKNIKSLEPSWLMMGMLCISVYLGMETLIQHMLTNKMQRGHSLWNAFKVVMTGQFFNAITPFASGGQPMQAFMMSKQGVPVGTSVSILMAKFIIYQIVLTIYSLLVIYMELSFFTSNISGLVYAALIGFTINLGIVGVLVASVFMKERLKRVGFMSVNLLSRVHLIKNPLEVKRHIVTQIELFNENIVLLKNNLGVLIKVSGLTIIQLTSYFLIPYAIYKAFGMDETKMFIIISAAAFIVMISSFIPVPGGSGVAEGSFYLFFGLFLPNHVLPTAILCWRLLTFYMPMCVGGIMTVLPDSKKKNIIYE